MAWCTAENHTGIPTHRGENKHRRDAEAGLEVLPAPHSGSPLCASSSPTPSSSSSPLTQSCSWKGGGGRYAEGAEFTWPSRVLYFIMNSLSEANDAFAIRLLKVLGQKYPACNVFYSPLSLSSSLARALLGAKGKTAAEIIQALALNTEDDIHQGFQSLLTQVHKSGAPFTFNIAKRLYADQSCIFLPSFKESCPKFYETELEQLSFIKETERSRKHINAWVSTKTEELLPQKAVDVGTRLVLVNAVYFKGRWDKQFQKSRTKKTPFKINQMKQKRTQMMFQEGTFPWAHVSEVQAQVLELPYAGQELSMILLLPDKGVDLSTVEKAFTFDKFRTWTSPEHMKKTKMEVYLPKFKLQGDYNMRYELQDVGLVDLFDCQQPDLSGMFWRFPHGDQCLSLLQHKTVLEVSEEGTEATASACEIEGSCARSLPVFRADHPFLFFIRHNSTNCLLFCGRILSPGGVRSLCTQALPSFPPHPIQTP
ncbi:PREDICTED: serpin B9-like [Chinchilla lanigera]|uniref:serpin B9-like n=1 Tax=Chinchilla lanigera TaxID=34839 RepID=UPI000696B23B|nr:PREDICTED: serpin B9-like [Chinchilla lanigera]